MKKKFSLFGNCQTHALKWLLQQSPDFAAGYEEIPVVESYLMSPEMAEDFCERVIPQADLIIAQPHSDRMSRWHQHDELRAACERTGARIIFIPQVYFSVYNPFEQSVPGIGNVWKDAQLVYLDRFMFSKILAGTSFEDFLAETEKSTVLRRHFLDQCMKICVNYQSDVEDRRACDIKILHYLLENMRSERLMRCNNHPAGRVMKFIADGVLRELGIDFSTIQTEMFQNHDSLIYPFVAEHFGFNVTSPVEEVERRFRYYTDFLAGLTPEEGEKLRADFEKAAWTD